MLHAESNGQPGIRLPIVRAHGRGRTRESGPGPGQSPAQKHRDLVCGMNHALIKGVVNAAGPPYSAARLNPAPG
jgi:hypothetical protein